MKSPSRSHLKITEDWLRPDHERAESLDCILDQLNELAVDSVGLDGVRAAWLLAMHAGNHLNVTRRVLDLLEVVAAVDPRRTLAVGIPFLVDALHLLGQGHRPGSLQEFGTAASYQTLVITVH